MFVVPYICICTSSVWPTLKGEVNMIVKRYGVPSIGCMKGKAQKDLRNVVI